MVGPQGQSLVVVVAVVGELLIFLVITAIVHRGRPAVPQLDQASPTSSFPSGHTGAAVALYVCLAVILLRQGQTTMARAGLAVLGCVIPSSLRPQGLSRHALPDRRVGRRARQRYSLSYRTAGISNIPNDASTQSR